MFAEERRNLKVVHNAAFVDNSLITGRNKTFSAKNKMWKIGQTIMERDKGDKIC